MRRICYSVAASLDGYIADPRGASDWIVMDPAIDFGELFDRFDTAVMGRRTFESARADGGDGAVPGMTTLVVSRTLRPEDHPGVAIVADRVVETLGALRQGEATGKDVWLFGGGMLFRTLLEARLVDAVEVAIVPVLLGGGVPLLPPPAGPARLRLVEHRAYPSGIVSLRYAVEL